MSGARTRLVWEARAATVVGVPVHRLADQLVVVRSECRRGHSATFLGLKGCRPFPACEDLRDNGHASRRGETFDRICKLYGWPQTFARSS